MAAARDRRDRFIKPGVPLYQNYAQILLALNDVPTLQQRVGNRIWNGAVSGDGSQGEPFSEGQGAWVRIVGTHSQISPHIETAATSYNLDSWKLQAGYDGLLSRDDDGAPDRRPHGPCHEWLGQHLLALRRRQHRHGGLWRRRHADLVWPDGFYADGQSQFTWFDSDLKSLAGKPRNGRR